MHAIGANVARLIAALLCFVWDNFFMDLYFNQIPSACPGCLSAVSQMPLFQKAFLIKCILLQ